MTKRSVEGAVVEPARLIEEDDGAEGEGDDPRVNQATAPRGPLVERASTVPELDGNTFGYYWERTPGEPPEWHIWAGDPKIFRYALADCLLNKRMTGLYFSASGVWLQVPLPPINSA